MKQQFTLLEIDTDLVFRAFAIITIIFVHARAAIFDSPEKLHVVGGSTLLLLISGFNAGRFQSKKLFEGLSLQIIFRFFRKIIIPYYVVLISYLAWKQEFDWHSLLLISNYYGRFRSFLDPYWFIELLFQILVIFYSLFLIPPFRKAAKKYPWYIGLGLLFFTVLLRLSNITDESIVTIRTPDRLLCIYVFGWCLCFAKTRLQKIVMVFLTLTVFPYLYGIYASYTIWLVLGTLAMMWKPKILMPQLLHTPVTQIGTSTFYIYLTHIIPIHLFVHFTSYHNVTAIILISLVLGILVNKGLTKIKL